MTATLEDVSTSATHTAPAASELPAPRSPLPPPRSAPTAPPAPQAAAAPHRPARAGGFAPSTNRLSTRGALDRPARRQLLARVQHAADRGATRVVLDLSQVPAMDGYVARDLLWQDWRLAHSGGGLRLSRPTRQVHRVLRWYGAGHLVLP